MAQYINMHICSFFCNSRIITPFHSIFVRFAQFFICFFTFNVTLACYPYYTPNALCCQPIIKLFLVITPFSTSSTKFYDLIRFRIN